jgi:hypothetical protein
MSVCTSGDRNNSLNRGFVGSAALAVHRGSCLDDVGLSSLVTAGVEPSSMRARPWSFVLVSSQYVYGVDC